MAIEPQLGELIDSSFPREDALRIRIFAEKLFARESRDSDGVANAETRLQIVRDAFELFSIHLEPIAVRVTPRDGIVVVETAMLDRPFIVDSLLEYYHQLHAPVRTMLHPVYRVARDGDGRIASFEQAHALERSESFTRTELELNASGDRASEIQSEVAAVLAEVQNATSDFHAMTARALQICDETASNRELVEVREFLRWLVQGGFVFLGYRRYFVLGGDGARKFGSEPGSELGIARAPDESRFRSAGPLDDLPPARRKLFFEGPPLVIGKSRAESQVHRRALMDSITIRREGASGKVEGFDQFLGLFTSKAYAEEAQHIPVLRAKLREVLEAERAAAGSHDYKQIVTAFNSFPKDELFRASVPELREQLRAVLDVKAESEVRLIMLADPRRGHVVALVVMPRDAFSAEVREKIQELLAERLHGSLVYYYLAIGEGYTARLHFCFAAESPRAALTRELETAVARLARRWEDRLHDRLVSRFGPARGGKLAARWRSAFGAEYKAAVSIARAVSDIEQIENVAAGQRAFAVECDPRAGELRIAGLGGAPRLSDLMPTLQNFGLGVVAEEAHDLNPEFERNTEHAYVQAFAVEGLKGEALDKLPGAALLAEAVAAVRGGIAEDDPLNALVLASGLNWRETALLRAYLAAAFQMRLAPARPALRRVLLQNPQLARALFELFAARLDPDRDEAVEKITAMRTAYLEKLSAIDNLADDRIARTLLAMVEATVRTNYFRPMPSPDPYLAIKLESARIPSLPDTPPLYEIHVNSPRMEGCHLRAGRIARGGIRFSDRPDDFRTEILGLMKTQTVKNAIIVPIGSKGGFVVRSAPGLGPPPGGDGEPAYRTLINAMLDLTDNVVERKIARPERVKVLDQDGPYLVVAADKGTAAFSDVANSIAAERGFWLGDAFASGGEHGYDHKKMGITARGAWESARGHLREMDRDPDRGSAITMVGIGDMSGDVFGNGLLRSQNVKLVAAFNHRHIFIDPDPDPETSYAERKRLFETPHSQWSDYDLKLISAGGGVFRRGQKRIELSAAARTALGIEAEALDGESLVRAILRAPVDLFYNGGIGTYVRATDETDAEVGDHANDECRVTAAELRAKIVIEGGNLGFTQKARIEYALGGGRINTDAIDNSAGVDMSDHEVNLKILLAPSLSRGALDSAERNLLLAACAEEVADKVLADNRDQALMLTLEQVRSRTHTSLFRDHIQAIEERGLLRRSEEALPTREALRERRSRYPGLTRPELAVITAYTKIGLAMRLGDTPLVADPYLVHRFLTPYFPAAIAARFKDEIPRHQLRRELIATAIANELVDLMGSVFVFGIARDHAVEASEVVRAWLIGGDLLGLKEKAEAIKHNPDMGAEAEVNACLALESAGRTAAAWALENCERSGSVGDWVARYRPGFDLLVERFETMLAAGELARFEKLYRDLRTSVGDGELAHELARLAFAGHLLNVLSLGSSANAEKAAQAYFGLTHRIDFAVVESALDAMSAASTDDRWERRAIQELAIELRAARMALCSAVFEDNRRPVAEAIEHLLDARRREFAEAYGLLAELKTATPLALSAVHVTIRALSRLANAASRSTPRAGT